jgi:hypothetical protein
MYPKTRGLGLGMVALFAAMGAGMGQMFRDLGVGGRAPRPGRPRVRNRSAAGAGRNLGESGVDAYGTQYRWVAREVNGRLVRGGLVRTTPKGPREGRVAKLARALARNTAALKMEVAA